jgi:hypothetical protein
MSNEHIINDGIHEFLEKYKNARNFNSKEIRLTIAEAERLSTGIALVLNRYKVLSDRVIDLQEELLNPEDITMSGGGFE